MSGLRRVLVGFWSGLRRVVVGFTSGFGRVLVGFMSSFGRVLVGFGLVLVGICRGRTCQDTSVVNIPIK